MGKIIHLDDYSDELLEKALFICDKENPNILAKTQKHVDLWLMINERNLPDDVIQKREKDFRENVWPQIQKRLHDK